MKHEVIKADMTFKKMGFIFECKYFDRKGDINKNWKSFLWDQIPKRRFIEHYLSFELMFSDWNLVGLNISAKNPKISVVADGSSIISLMSAKGISK